VEEPDVRVIESAPLPYLLSVPADRGPEGGAWPVLCFLHGYDEAAPTEIRRALTRHGPLRPGSAPRAVRDFIVLAPQLPHAGDVWYRYADAVRQIVVQVQRAHEGDPRRTYLSGFSFGGNGAFDLAIARTGFWAALWPVDPTRVPREDPGSPIWLSLGEVARRRKDAFVRALDLEPVGAAPVGNRLYLDEGQDHVGSATLAYGDERIYAWLLSKRLPSDRLGA
jgi:predicted peptidase